MFRKISELAQSAPKALSLFLLVEAAEAQKTDYDKALSGNNLITLYILGGVGILAMAGCLYSHCRNRRRMQAQQMQVQQELGNETNAYLLSLEGELAAAEPHLSSYRPLDIGAAPSPERDLTPYRPFVA